MQDVSHNTICFPTEVLYWFSELHGNQDLFVIYRHLPLQSFFDEQLVQHDLACWSRVPYGGEFY